MKNFSKAKKAAFFGLLGALALVLSFFESRLMPDIPFMPPGAKPGLSNVVTMLTMSLSGLSGAMYITLLKGLFAFVTRGAFAGMMSLSGGIVSTALCFLLMRYGGEKLSFIGIAVPSAAAHNIGQLVCACVLSGTAAMFNYGKYLLIFSVITGVITGAALNIIMPRLRKIRYIDINLKP